MKIDKNFENLEECILFGFQSDGEILHVLNYCLLHVKFYIYKQKLADKKIDFYEFLMEFKYVLNIERNICKENNSLSFHKFDFIDI